MKNIEMSISLVKPQAIRAEANKMNNSEKQTAIELLLGPKNTVKIPARSAKLIKYPAMKIVILIINNPKNSI